MSVVHTSPFRHTQLLITDPAEFERVLSGSRLRADFLSRQERAAYVEQFQTPGWAMDFDRGFAKLRVDGAPPPGWATLGFMHGHAESMFHGVAGVYGRLVCLPPGADLDCHSMPGFACIAVNVPPSLWERCRALAGVERSDFGSAAGWQLPPAHFAHLERCFLSAREQLRLATGAPQLASFAMNEAAAIVAELATTAWELSARSHSTPDSLRNAVRLVRRAETWMRDHLAEPIQIPDVCLALRVSRRGLEYAFRAVLDKSPHDFIAALRLNAIRRALRSTDQPVTQVALDHGITHLGRFAANYRALFGEPPSETRRG